MADEEKGFTIRDKRSFVEGSDSVPKKEKGDREKKEFQSHKAHPQHQRKTEINFSTFLFSLGNSALIALGEETNPFTGEKSVNLPQAQESIELLSILQEKTKGNLTSEEESLLSNLLFSVRMKYVDLARKHGPQ